MSTTITITDPLPGTRKDEPVIFSVPGVLEGDLRVATTSSGDEVICQRLASRSNEQGTSYVAVLSFSGSLTLTLGGPVPTERVVDGIRELEPREADAFVRLDTGFFDLEMCSGTARGEGASKWGLRHFASKVDGVDLLPSGNNAIGGFYGPFFTPENGLINPPEHTTVDIDVIERGPLLHHYRMRGTVPDGLLDELRGKGFSIDWVFTYGTPYFQRKYEVDPFRTVINGRSISNKITVGDEFEGGAGRLVFDRFETYGGTRYRAGDPYAQELVTMVDAVLGESRSENEKFARFKEQLQGDIESAHWDLYWRLFCVWEGALENSEIRERLSRVRERSHVRADDVDRPWIVTEDPVDVSALPDATIFPGAASKSVEFHSKTGRTMVWWTSRPSGAFQIVQRRQSGWVNWGSNGENECPELPVGVDIKTGWAASPEGWRVFADQLETPPSAVVAQA